MSEKLWWISVGYEPIGPVPKEEITRLLEKGEANRNSQVWREGMPDWTELEQTELGSLIREEPPLPNVIQPKKIGDDEIKWIPSAAQEIDRLISEELERHNTENKEVTTVQADLSLPSLSDASFIIPEPKEIPEEIPKREKILRGAGITLKSLLVSAMTFTILGGIYISRWEFKEKVEDSPPKKEPIVEKVEEKKEELPKVIEQPTTTLKKKTKQKRWVRVEKVTEPPQRMLKRLSTQDIVKGVKNNAKTTVECIRNARRRGELPSGSHKLILNWVINSNGSVSNPRMIGPKGLINTSLPKCIQRQMKGWKFPSSSDPSTINNYPFGPFKVR